MSPAYGNAGPSQPRAQVLTAARAAKRALDDIIRPLNSKAAAQRAENDADYWGSVWRTAQHLRIQVDKLAIHAQAQGRRCREDAHPANQPADAWESSGGQDDVDL